MAAHFGQLCKLPIEPLFRPDEPKKNLSFRTGKCASDSKCSQANRLCIRRFGQFFVYANAIALLVSSRNLGPVLIEFCFNK